ncbi:MAG: TonB-dependent receptor [Acidobacteria bacterium]|nr:TonB-dependent receptor [Acidobacteriota bacterium]
MRQKTWLLILGLLWAALTCDAAEIRGKVTDSQGTAIDATAIVVQQNGSPVGVSSLTGQDGTYSIANLPPGAYVLVAQKPGYLQQAQGPVQVPGDGESLTVNFRLVPSREAEAVRGAEERNPNDFIIRLDTNAVQNELARTGANLRFFPEFRAANSYYGEQFGYPLRPVEAASLARPVAGWHGSLYEFHQNRALNARPFFQVGSLLASRRNQYGFSLSGPIRTERLWFNFAWGQVRDSGYVNGNVQVPLAHERTAQSLDPQMNAIIDAVLKAYPTELPNLPHVSIRHLNTNSLRDIRSTAFSVHLDYQPRPGDSLAYDQQFQDSTEEPFELVIGQNPRTLARPQSARLTYSHSLSPRTVSQIAVNYRRLATQLLLTQKYQSLLESVGISSPPDIEFSDEISNVGMSGQGIPRKRFENHYQVSPQITHSHGRHSLAAGLSVKHMWDSDERSSQGRGTFTFSPDSLEGISRTAVENFLRGAASRLTLTVGNQYRGYRNWEYVFYFQDRFQLRPNLSLIGGLRYEILTVPREVNDLFQFVHSTDANNFAPQLGFAWSPRSGNTVLRGGYAVAFGTIGVGTFNRQSSNPPHTQSLSVDTPGRQDWLNIDILQPIPGRRANLNQVDPDTVVPYTHIYNLAVEQELPGDALLRVGYLGSRGLKMFTGVTLNRARLVEGIDSISKTVNARRPDPRYQKIYDIMNASIGYADALQVSVSKRRTHGLTLEARYSFGKVIDTGGANFADPGNGGDVSQSEELFLDMKSVSSFDTPHSFTINYSYELPLPDAGQGWLSRLLARWVVSGTTTFRSGTPFTVFTGSDGPRFGNVDGEGNDRPNINNAALLGSSFDDPDASAVLLGADKDCVLLAAYLQCKYFDTSIAVGGRGNLGYRTFRKDGTNNWNLALARSFVLGGNSERQLQFRAEFFNLFNHAQFAAPGYLLSSPTFGKITNTVNKGRVTQFTLRFLF